MASTAICSAVFFAVQVPATIHNHQETLDGVWDKLSSPLAQFEIYSEMPDPINKHLYEKLEKFMIGFVRLCAFVVVIKNGTKGAKWKENFGAVYNNGQTRYHKELDSFEKASQDFRNVEGSSILLITKRIELVVVGTQKGVKELLSGKARVQDLEAIAKHLNLPAEETDPSVQFTRHCSGILRECIPNTGKWILSNPLYNDWTDVDNQDARLLVVRGPQSSGKTFLSAIVANERDHPVKRRHAAHHTFVKREKKGERVNNLVQFAVMQMAFRLACSDSTIQRTLSDKCKDISQHLRQSNDNLATAWDKLNIGASQSKSAYYLIFDGLEDLSDTEFDLLQKFIKHLMSQSPPQNRVQDQPQGRLNERIRILITIAADSSHNVNGSFSGPPEIDISRENKADLEEYTRNTLGTKLQVVPRNVREHIEDRIMKKLPKNAQGRYTVIDVGLAKVMRLVIGRHYEEKNLDAVLKDPTKIQKEDLEEMQQLLTTDDIRELNDIIHWIFASEGHTDDLTLEQLESALVRQKLLLWSGFILTRIQNLNGPRASIIALEHVIKTKYSAILSIEDDCVYLRKGVTDVLTTLSKASRDRHTAGQPMISMKITIHKASQEECASFFWDLAHTAAKAKHEFLLDNSSRMYSHAIMGNAFDATKSVVLQAFQHLSASPKQNTGDIGAHIVLWLPSYLNRLKKLETEDKFFLTAEEESTIEKGLYDFFSSSTVIENHSSSFQKATWLTDEIKMFEHWLRDDRIMRIHRDWASEQLKNKPVAGFLKSIVDKIVRGFLMERTWDVSNAYSWISLFMELVSVSFVESRLKGSAAADDRSCRMMKPTNLTGKLARLNPAPLYEVPSSELVAGAETNSDSMIKSWNRCGLKDLLKPHLLLGKISKKARHCTHRRKN
jgi:hypothetical protein